MNRIVSFEGHKKTRDRVSETINITSAQHGPGAASIHTEPAVSIHTEPAVRYPARTADEVLKNEAFAEARCLITALRSAGGSLGMMPISEAFRELMKNEPPATVAAVLRCVDFLMKFKADECEASHTKRKAFQ